MRRRAFLRLVLGGAFASSAGPLLGCAGTPTPAILVPSLEPIDPSKPRIRYRPIRGIGRGPRGLLAALKDIQRLTGVDGYLQVSVETVGSEGGTSTIVTAYPFTYGDEPKPISIRVGQERFGEPPRRLLAPSPFVSTDCLAGCGEQGSAAVVGVVARKLAARRCRRQCSTVDPLPSK